MNKQDTWNKHMALGLGIVGGAVGIGVFGTCIFRVAKPSQYLVQTGLGIKSKMGMRVSRSAFVLPLVRRVTVVEMRPRTVDFVLPCISEEFLKFDLPVTFTISPRDPQDPDQIEQVVLENSTEEQPVTAKVLLDNEVIKKDVIVSSEDLFKRYVQKVNCLTEEEFRALMKIVMHGTARGLTARMKIDSLNSNRPMFHSDFVVLSQQVIRQYGLNLDNANIAEIIEHDRGKGQKGYLEAREQKKLSEAVQQSEVFVAEATKKGDIGKKQLEADTRQAKAQLEALTKQIEFDTQQQIAIASANLEVIKSESKQREEVSRIRAASAALLCQQELQLQIEQKREDQLLIAKRADQLTSKKVAAECAIVDSKAIGDAMLAEATGKAQSIETVAKALRFEGEQKAAVVFANLKAEADGKLALLRAQATGTEELVKACGNKPELVSTILGIFAEIPQIQAKESAKAVQNLNPQIWSLSGDSAGTQVANMLASLTPVIDVYKKMVTKD
jgi:flotillin